MAFIDENVLYKGEAKK